MSFKMADEIPKMSRKCNYVNLTISVSLNNYKKKSKLYILDVLYVAKPLYTGCKFASMTLGFQLWYIINENREW